MTDQEAELANALDIMMILFNAYVRRETTTPRLPRPPPMSDLIARLEAAPEGETGGA